MITLNEVNVINAKIGFEEIIENVDKIVEGSFDENGRHHSYLTDYCYASTVLKLFTDYNGDYDFNEVMEMYSDKINWDLMESKCGNGVYCLCRYVFEEIDYLTQPMASVDELVRSIKKVVDKVDKLTDSIDTEKVMNFIENLDVDAVNKFSNLIGSGKK